MTEVLSMVRAGGDRVSALVPARLRGFVFAYTGPLAVALPVAASVALLCAIPPAALGTLLHVETLTGFATLLVVAAVACLLIWAGTGQARRLFDGIRLGIKHGQHIRPEQVEMFVRLRRNWATVCEANRWGQQVERTRWEGLGSQRHEVREKVWDAPRILRVTSEPSALLVICEVPMGTVPSAYAAASEAWRAALGAHSVRIEEAGAGAGTMGPALALRIGTGDALAGTVETGKDYSMRALGPVDVARYEDGSRFSWDVTEASHTIVQGMTRSGKSVATYGLLSQLARMPDDAVEVWGIDPASVLLGPWEDRVGGRERIVLGTEDAQAAFDLLWKLVQKMESRLARLREEGREKLEAGDARTLVVVLEEYPGLLRAIEQQDRTRPTKERLGSAVQALVDRLLSEGAKVGVRVLMIVQRADASIVGGYARGQFGTRLSFAVDTTDAVQMLHPTAARETVDEVRNFPPGRALVWHHRREQTAQFDLTDYGVYRYLVLNGGPPEEQGYLHRDDEPISFA